MGLPCPPLATGCAAAHLCELSFKLFPKFCGVAAGDWTQGCYAAAHALCGPEGCGECGSILGMPGTISSVGRGGNFGFLIFDSGCIEFVRSVAAQGICFPNRYRKRYPPPVGRTERSPLRREMRRGHTRINARLNQGTAIQIGESPLNLGHCISPISHLASRTIFCTSAISGMEKLVRKISRDAPLVPSVIS